ncbi:MAG: type II toxin-antitoxin system RelE/ParE family toxin [Bacteroidetes bacterium]|nr:type II toxin-antitoxin system RelE/ParE family toxin [Bacteroidota bacterium]MCB0845488.1 type II toxin-antitoxin system RelE/ParE family toxin [Bacteroidota bacterium]MCB0855867.1 type II toxin-antitoxin system RelE/ParE family toxin [Bacteroidota bacterium]
MKYTVEVRDTFRESIDEVYEYHEKRKSGEGSDVLEAVWDKIEALELNPKMYQIRYDDIRVAPVKVKYFQYHIIYRIIEPKVIAIDFVSQSSDWLPS